MGCECSLKCGGTDVQCGGKGGFVGVRGAAVSGRMLSDEVEERGRAVIVSEEWGSRAREFARK